MCGYNIYVYNNVMCWINVSITSRPFTAAENVFVCVCMYVYACMNEWMGCVGKGGGGRRFVSMCYVDHNDYYGCIDSFYHLTTLQSC